MDFLIRLSIFVQIISCIFLLRSNQLDVLQTNIIGGILSSILLVLGLGIFLVGVNGIEERYNMTVAHLSANLLSLAATSLLIPTTSHLLLQTPEEHILRQSQGAAFIMLVVYGAFLVFGFYSHIETWNQPNEKTPKRRPAVEAGDVIKGVVSFSASLSAFTGGSVVQELPFREPEEVKIPYLVIVATSRALVRIFAVDSIDALSSKVKLSKTFIGLILLPILNNDLTPINHAIDDDMHMTMNVKIGKCLQTSLFVTPLMVRLAWGMGRHLTLNVYGFGIASLFASVLLLNYLIIDAKSSW